jgi:hypothetical protein
MLVCAVRTAHTATQARHHTSSKRKRLYIPTTSYTGLATLTYGEHYQHTTGALKVHGAETQLATSQYPFASLPHLQRPSVNTYQTENSFE